MLTLTFLYNFYDLYVIYEYYYYDYFSSTHTHRTIVKHPVPVAVPAIVTLTIGNHKNNHYCNWTKRFRRHHRHRLRHFH